jgi:predicted nucleic acid-binding protein
VDTGATSATGEVIVVDSSIWIDHIHRAEPVLGELLMRDHALMHPHALGEVALGSIKGREAIIDRFLMLPVPNIAEEGHVLFLIDDLGLFATGVGYTDAHLLASAMLTPGGRLWTRDKRLLAHAERLEIAFTPA